MESRPFHEHYRHLLAEVTRIHSGGGVHQHNQRTGQAIFVIPGGRSFLLDLSNNVLPTAGVRRVYPASAAAEVAWFMMGTQNATWLLERAPLWTKFVEGDGVTVKGAYGHRWRHHFGRDQIMDAIHKLHLDPSTRQVNISAWDPAIDGVQPAKNIPCPTNFTLSILDGRLHSSLFLRSSDLFVGLPYDVMAHAMVMNAILWNLRDMGNDLTLGTMHVTLAHAHLYEAHLPLAQLALEGPITVPTHTLGKWSVYAIVSQAEAFHHYHREQAKKHVWPDVHLVKPEVFA